MISKNYNILICDDDHSFAKNLKSVFERKLKLINSKEDVKVCFEIITVYDDLTKLVSNSEKAQNYNIIFCDLGWGNQNLAGVQILNDFQMSHPYGKTVLYTAQDADEIISQTLEWKLHFIDRVVAIQGSDYVQDLFNIIEEFFSEDELPDDEVVFKGKRMISETDFQGFLANHLPQLKNFQKLLGEFLESCDNPLAAKVLFDKEQLQVQFQASQSSQAVQKYNLLLENYRKFPNLENHDLLALSKTKYFEFIKKTYGGFPEMAKARFLDLNNIYRANRKFKNQEFIVFQFETILEIMGNANTKDSFELIQDLLANANLLKTLVENK